MKKVFIISLLIMYLFSACGNATASPALTILPQNCELPIATQIPITLNGPITPNSQVVWQTNLGSIVNNSQGFSAVYTAPSVAGEALITATITSATTLNTIELNITCRILNGSTSGTLNGTASIVPASPSTVVISEVMGNTCGDVEQKKYNQYIELYNYGTQPVDVGGWWIYDEGTSGTPDEIATWKTRSPIPLGEGLVLDSTVIPAKGVAVILSPQYPENLNIEKMPYRFPAGTVILSVAASNTLGDDFFGIITDQDGYETVTLYIGGAAVMKEIVDTYGTPLIISDYPFEIDDDHRDNIPTYLSDCYSIERIDPYLPDRETNWKPVFNGSPGEVPYP